MIRHAGLGADPLEHAHAVEAGHYEVEEHEGNRGAVGALEDRYRLLAGRGSADFEAKSLDSLFQQATLNWIVIDNRTRWS
jgi:hypothetical protein